MSDADRARLSKQERAKRRRNLECRLHARRDRRGRRGRRRTDAAPTISMKLTADAAEGDVFLGGNSRHPGGGGADARLWLEQ